MDVGTGLALLGSAELVQKLFGKTFEHLGEALDEAGTRGVTNLARIVRSAKRRLGEHVEQEGGVADRVLGRLVNEGMYCDDPLTAEYLGGVLASSRTSSQRDDRGATWMALVTRMSSYQLRLHYIIYSVLRDLALGRQIQLGVQAERQALRVFVPFAAYLPAMDFSVAEEWQVITSHSIWGLLQEGLIDDEFASGSVGALRKQSHKSVPSDGLVVGPTSRGAELFMWGHGHGQLATTAIFDPAIDFTVEPPIEIAEGSALLSVFGPAENP